MGNNGINYIHPEFEVVRDQDKCIACRVCERQCANEVHYMDEDGVMRADNSKCVNCHRCVSLCPTGALKIVKSDHTFRPNGNWTAQVITELYRQAGSGGVLLSSMGNPTNLPVYWDRILLNASQVTNPSIDPLREPMETVTFLGKKPKEIVPGRGRQHCQQPHPSDPAEHSHYVLCHELRFHQLQRP